MNDLRISLLNISSVRNGFDILDKIKYENIGTTLLSGNAELLFDALQTYLPGLTNPSLLLIIQVQKPLPGIFQTLTPGRESYYTDRL